MKIKKVMALILSSVIAVACFCFTSNANAADDTTAWISFADSAFSVSYFDAATFQGGLENGVKTVAVSSEKTGTYTASIDFTKSTPGSASDVAVLLLSFADYADFANATISVDDVTIDGTSQSVGNVSFINDGGKLKANIFNTYDNVALIDVSGFTSVKSLSVTFTVSITAQTEATTTEATTTEPTTTTTEATTTTTPATTTEEITEVVDDEVIDETVPEEDEDDDQPNPKAPTFSFDMAGASNYFTLVDTANTANISFKQATDKRISGGSLKVSCKNTETIDNEVILQGIAINAADFGLPTFRGCKIIMHVYFPAEVTELMDFAQLYCTGPDGSWKQYDMNTVSGKDRWNYAVLTCPTDASPSIIGLKLPISGPYEGTLCYIENVEIFDADGNKILNIDGWDERSAENAVANPIEKIETPVLTTAATTAKVDDGDEGGIPKIAIIIIAIVAVVLIVGSIVTLLIVKTKKSYY